MEKGDNPYEILGVSEDATESEIKKAYRKGALKYHPDKQQTEEDKVAASAIFTKMADAYDTLTDPVKRYDYRMAQEKKKAPPPKRQSAPAPGGSRGPPPPSRAPQRQSYAPGSGRGQPPPPQKRPSGGRGPPPPNAQKKQSAPPTSSSGRGQPRRPSSKSPPPPGHQKRHSAPLPGQRPPGAGASKRMSAPVGPSKPKYYRDPFDIFDKVMKEELGEDYKEKREWKDEKGVLGLSKMPNPFAKKKENTHKEFKKLDINKDKSLSKDELRVYIESHSALWTMLGKNLNLSIKRCVKVATDVAFQLATGVGVDKPLTNKFREEKRELTEKEFKNFHKNYILNEKGSKEFFLRTIFSAFDANGDGVMQRSELAKFLDIFYDATDVFKGNMRLPPKKELHRLVMGRLDKNKDGVLSFHEIKDLLEVAAVVAND